MGAETDQIGLLTKLPAAELTNIVLAASSHLGRSCVAHVRIVRPYHGFAVPAVKREQILQCFEHMTVAQIP